jgi:hypothetical protein
MYPVVSFLACLQSTLGTRSPDEGITLTLHTPTRTTFRTDCLSPYSPPRLLPSVPHSASGFLPPQPCRARCPCGPRIGDARIWGAWRVGATQMTPPLPSVLDVRWRTPCPSRASHPVELSQATPSRGWRGVGTPRVTTPGLRVELTGRAAAAAHIRHQLPIAQFRSASRESRTGAGRTRCRPASPPSARARRCPSRRPAATAHTDRPPVRRQRRKTPPSRRSA